MRTGLGLRIIGSRHSSDATRLREVRGPQPAAPRLDRARGGPQGRSLAREVRCEAIGDAGDHLAGQGRAQEPDERRACPGHRPQGRRPPGTNLRPRRGGGGACGPRRGGLRGFGGPLYPRPRVDGPGGAGGHLVADRELPGFPRGSLRLRARQPRPGPGRQVRRPTAVPQEAVSSEKGGRPLPHRALRGRRGGGAQRDSRDRGPLPQAGGARPRAFRGRERPLRRHGGRGSDGAKARRSRSSAGATRRARRRCSWRDARGGCTCS